MAKILGQAGISLADIYDVEGSIAGIERLEAEDLHLVHEVGTTVFSERFGGEIVRLDSTAVLQNVAFDITTLLVGSNFTRVFGVQVFADVTSRLDNVAVSIRDVPALNEIPIFIWDSNDTERTVRIVDDGAAAADVFMLMGAAQVPSMTFGNDQPTVTNGIVMRGESSGFGAGDVTCVALVYLGFASGAGGLSSFGLPVPSW